jgi:hypothetical protein
MSDIQAKLNRLTPEQRKLLLKELQKKKRLGESGPQPIAISNSLKRRGMDVSVYSRGDHSIPWPGVVECARRRDQSATWVH